MIRTKCFGFVLGLFAAHAVAHEIRPVAGGRCGGDGPRPLTDVSAEVQSSIRILPTESSVAEFVALPKSGDLIYRTESGTVTRYTDGLSRVYTLGSSFAPLSSVLNAAEDTLLVNGAAWYRSTSDIGSWVRFDNKVFHPLFWAGKSLYGYQKFIGATSNADTYSFERYDGFRRVGKACRVQPHTWDGAKLGWGHSYPNVYFFSSRQMGRTYQVSYWQLNVESCQYTQFVYPSRFPHPAKRVAVFDDGRATLVHFSGGEENLLWQKEYSCKGFNVGESEVLALRNDIPVLATWGKSQALSLLFIEDEKTYRLLGNYYVTGFREQDVWINADATEILLAPYFGSPVDKRWILKQRLHEAVWSGRPL